MRYSLHCFAPVALVAVTCPAGSVEAQISREEAIEIACQEVAFQPNNVDAVISTADERAVWRVRFLGQLPGQPPELSEMVIVEVDADTGEVVSIART